MNVFWRISMFIDIIVLKAGQIKTEWMNQYT